MKVKVRYFAGIREALGPGESFEIEPGRRVSDLRERLIGRSPAHAAALAHGRLLRCALDQVLCDESASLQDGSEVAFFPPVTGG